MIGDRYKNDRIPIKDCLLLPLGALLATLMVFMIEYIGGHGLIQGACRLNVTQSALHMLATQSLSSLPTSPSSRLSSLLYQQEAWSLGPNDNDLAAPPPLDDTTWLLDNQFGTPLWWSSSDLTIIPAAAATVATAPLSSSTTHDASTRNEKCVPCNGVVFVSTVWDEESFIHLEATVTSLQHRVGACPILVIYMRTGGDNDVINRDWLAQIRAWNNVVVMIPSSINQDNDIVIPSLSHLRPWVIREAFNYLNAFAIHTAKTTNANKHSFPWRLPYGCQSLSTISWLTQLRVLYMDPSYRLSRSDIDSLISVMSSIHDNNNRGTRGAFYIPLQPRPPANGSARPLKQLYRVRMPSHNRTTRLQPSSSMSMSY
jgi:hypothetical protein